jgi:patatin-like phospholipase/acyl hydrolase
MKPYRILTLDGGGVRGVLSAVLLRRLEEIQPGFLQKVDMFAGTSTGGILALALAAGFTPDECKQLYVENSPRIFNNPVPDWLDGGSLFGAKYDNRNLAETLHEYFGEKKLSHLLPRNILISSFDLDNSEDETHQPEQFRSWKAKFFHNFPSEESGTDMNEAIVDVALRTSAAPTYFPVYDGYVDGGVVANNPSVCALTQALDSAQLTNERGEYSRVTLDRMVLLSIGTGRNQQFVRRNEGAGIGLTGWARHLVSILVDGTADVAHYQCKQLLRERYCRLNPTLRESVSLDDHNKIKRLIEYAVDADISRAAEWLKTYFAD